MNTLLFANATTYPNIATFLGLNGIIFADSQPGATADVKITNAIGALPAAGGIIDARGLQGAQTISAQILINKPIVLYLGNATYTVASSVGANDRDWETGA